MPLIISQTVREHLGVRLLAFGTIVKTHLTALAAALQLQEPEKEKCHERKVLMFPQIQPIWAVITSLVKHNVTVNQRHIRKGLTLYISILTESSSAHH